MDSASISYRDNTKSGTIAYINITEAKLEKGTICLTLIDTSHLEIKLNEMNFSAKDQLDAFNELSKRIVTVESN